MIDEFVSGASWLGERTFGGQGPIPVRRPYDSLGGGGVALVGDAACQVFASHGSGVGMGLIAGSALAEAANRASDPGADDVVHAYERMFRRRYGGFSRRRTRFVASRSDSTRNTGWGAAPRRAGRRITPSHRPSRSGRPVPRWALSLASPSAPRARRTSRFVWRRSRSAPR